MPIEFTPPRRLLNAVLRLRDRMHGKDGGPDMRAKLTSEPIESVNQDGTYQVRGTPLSATGFKQLEPGEVVVVAWKQGKPTAIVAHQVQRAQFPQISVVGGPLVEELFLATRADGTMDVFFRNSTETAALKLDRFVDPTALANVKWGATNEWFFCRISTPPTQRFAIFHLKRQPNKGIGSGAANIVSLDRVEDLATKTLTLTTLAFDAAGNPAAINATPQGGSGYTVSVDSLCLDTAGALIVTFLIGTAFSVAPDNLPTTPNPNFTSSLGAFAGQPGVSGGCTYPVVADVTNGVVLLSLYDTPKLFAPLGWPLIDYNGTPRSVITFYDGSIFNAIVRPTTWEQANTVTFTIDPPFEGHTTIDATWWTGFSQTPSATSVRLEPILVLDRTVPVKQRLRGFSAWFRASFLSATGQTYDVADWHFFLFPNSPATQYQPVSPGPFPITDATAAGVEAPYSLTLFPLYAYPTRPAAGLSVAPTLNHLAWRAATTVNFFSSDNGLDVGGADTPGFVTELAKGAAAQITPTMRASIGRRGLVFARTDFLYQLDNPVTPFPPNTKSKFFVNAWAFAGAVTLNSGAQDFPPELAALTPFKGLADIPSGVVQPTGPDQFSVYVNNDKDTLSPLSLFEDLPAPPPV